MRGWRVAYAENSAGRILMRSIVITAIAALAFASSAIASPHCATGVPCGNTCIARNAICHVNVRKTPGTARQTPTCKPCGTPRARIHVIIR